MLLTSQMKEEILNEEQEGDSDWMKMLKPGCGWSADHLGLTVHGQRRSGMEWIAACNHC